MALESFYQVKLNVSHLLSLSARRSRGCLRVDCSVRECSAPLNVQ